MKLHLLLTTDIAPFMPKSCQIIHDFGSLEVIFGDDMADIKEGKHCVVEDTEENINAWLKPFAGFVKGNGSPITEKFTIAHIK